MSSENPDDNRRPIPKLFYNDLTGAPMHQCISCETDLMKSAMPYFIEKAIKPIHGYKAYNTIFEYAMCTICMNGHRGKISTQSMAAINKYFIENIDLDRRKYLLDSELYDDIGLWIDNCLIKGIDVTKLGECQIYAQCIGDQMTIGEYPYMISGEAMNEVVELLSPETLDEFDKLKNDLVGPSEFQDLLQGGPKVLL